MKRSAHLQTLSHDHHQGLAASVRLRQLLDRHAVGEAATFVTALWMDELVPHFTSEETHLLPALHTLRADALAARLCREHRRLHRLAGADHSSGAASAETLRTFGEQLRAHIRFEERIVFPYLEQHLPDDVLLHISEQLQAA